MFFFLKQQKQAGNLKKKNLIWLYSQTVKTFNMAIRFFQDAKTAQTLHHSSAKTHPTRPPSAKLSCAELTGWGDRLSSGTVLLLVCAGLGVVLEVELRGLRQLLLHLFQHAGHGHGLEETLAHAGPGRYPADTETTTKSAD